MTSTSFDANQFKMGSSQNKELHPWDC